jgi:hypothetical protein
MEKWSPGNRAFLFFIGACELSKMPTRWEKKAWNPMR